MTDTATKRKPKAETPSKAKATRGPAKMTIIAEGRTVTAECEGVKASFELRDGNVYLNGTQLPAATIEAFILSGISTRLRGSINGAKTPDSRKTRFSGLLDRLAKGTLGDRAARVTDPALKLALREAERKVRAKAKADMKAAGKTLKDYRYKDFGAGDRSIRAAAMANRDKFVAWARAELAKPKTESAEVDV